MTLSFDCLLLRLPLCIMPYRLLIPVMVILRTGTESLLPSQAGMQFVVFTAFRISNPSDARHIQREQCGSSPVCELGHTWSHYHATLVRKPTRYTGCMNVGPEPAQVYNVLFPPFQGPWEKAPNFPLLPISLFSFTHPQAWLEGGEGNFPFIFST